MCVPSPLEANPQALTVVHFPLPNPPPPPSFPPAGKLPDDLIRLSIGIEDPEDLIADIAQAFELASHPHVTDVRSVRRKDTADENELAKIAGPAAATTPAAPGPEADAAAIARGEVAKLAVMVKYLKERLADSEARAADLASQRVLLGAGAGAGAGSGSPEAGGAGAGAGAAPWAFSPSGAPGSPRSAGAGADSAAAGGGGVSAGTVVLTILGVTAAGIVAGILGVIVVSGQRRRY